MESLYNTLNCTQFQDEYKKEHSFYDDAHHGGHKEKYGNHHEHHGHKHGGHHKGGHHESAYKVGSMWNVLLFYAGIVDIHFI